MAHSCYSPPPNIRQQFVSKLSFDGVKLMIPKPAEEIILMSVSWYLIGRESQLSLLLALGEFQFLYL